MIHEEEEKKLLFNIIKDDIVYMAYHPKGNFVLLSVLQIFKGSEFDYITEHLIGNNLIINIYLYFDIDHIINLSFDVNGVCIINKIVFLT